MYHTLTPAPAQSKCAITHHADARMQQRGISEEMIDWAIQIGTVFQKQGMDMVVVRKKDIPKSMSRQARRKTDRARHPDQGRRGHHQLQTRPMRGSAPQKEEQKRHEKAASPCRINPN